jgi:hypothetical protein
MKERTRSCKIQINDFTPTQLTKQALDRGPYGTLLCPIDYIDIMEQYIGMLDQELDTKTTILFSLHEQESSFVLNTYLITWKKQPFQDAATLRGIDMRLNMNEKMKNKI